MDTLISMILCWINYYKKENRKHPMRKHLSPESFCVLYCGIRDKWWYI